MPLLRLNHLINGVAVPYTRRCEIVSRNGDKVVVKIKGAADGHYRNRTVNKSQVYDAQGLWDETRLSGGIGSDAERDSHDVGQVAAV